MLKNRTDAIPVGWNPLVVPTTSLRQRRVVPTQRVGLSQFKRHIHFKP